MKPMHLIRAIRKWWLGRRFGLLLGGLPAVCVGLVVTIFSFLSYSQGTQQTKAEYASLADTSYTNKDYVPAGLYYKRLVGWTDGRPDVLLRLAKISYYQGDREQSRELFRLVVEAKGKEAAEAHLWLASQTLEKQSVTREDLILAKQHLLKALQGAIKNRSQAQYYVGRIFLLEGKLGPAETFFRKVVNVKPQAHYDLAIIYRLRGKKDRSRRETQLAISHFRPRAEADVTDNSARLLWGKCLQLDEEYAKADKIFREGLANATSKRHKLIYATHLALLYLAWSDSLQKADSGPPSSRIRPGVWFGMLGNPGPISQACYVPAITNEATLGANLGRRLELLEKGIQLDPTNTQLLDRFLAMTNTSGLETKLIQHRFRQLLVSGNPSGAAHFALGVLDWQEGRKKEAQLHFEQAYRLAPTVPLFANNKATMLGESSSEKDWRKGVNIATMALRRSGGGKFRFRLYETRGTLLMKLKMWQEALQDFEKVSKDSPKNAEVLQNLATIYQALGDATLASHYRQKAKEQMKK